MRNKAAMGVLLAARHKLPMVYAERCFVISGGPDFLRPSFRRAVSGIGRLRRKGKKPADLPIVGATNYEVQELSRRVGSSHAIRFSSA